MPASRLPPRPSLTYLRRQGKKLLLAVQSGDPEALSRVRKYLPKQRSARLDGHHRDVFGLRDAFLVLAREYGFSSWPKFREHISAQVGDNPVIKADVHHAFFGCCENLNLEGMKEHIARGGDPNEAVNDGWDCDVLHGCLQTYRRREPEHFHACINTLIDGGADYEEGVLWDLWRGRKTELEKQLGEDPELLNARFQLDIGNHLTLRGAALLHIAVEYNLEWAVDLLLDRGADLNARTEIGTNGVGGQTPLYHAIGSNQGSCYELFEHLLEKNPDRNVRAMIQEEGRGHGQSTDSSHKGKEHFYDKILELTPLGYALRYEHEPDWRNAAREVIRLQELGAPEA